MKKAEKLLSIIIVSFNTKDILRECLKCVVRHSRDMDSEILVVDNASTDGSADMVATEFPEVTLIVSPGNRGFAGGNNLALTRASGRYLLLLNSDAYVGDSVLGDTMGFMEQNRACGVLGVRLVGEDGRLQPSARALPSPWFKFLVITGIAAKFPRSRLLGGPDYPWWDHGAVKEVGWVPGAYFLIRREVTEKIGFLDERYFLYFEEIDFCLQAQRAGFKILFYPGAEIIHLGGQSSSTTRKPLTSSGRQLIHLRIKSEFRYYRKNYGLVKVLESAGVELLWKAVIWAKNLLFSGDQSALKREEASLTIRLILSILVRDRFGARTTPGP